MPPRGTLQRWTIGPVQALARPRAHRGRRRARLGGLAILVAAAALAAVELFGGGAAAGAQLAESFARSWAARDWPALYADLDARSRASLSLTRFIERERGALDLSTTTRVIVGTASAAGSGVYEIPVVLQTRIFGTLGETFQLSLSGRGSSPKVRWNDAASFPGLHAGERLRRIDSAPRRGSLLARDGTPLRDVAAAVNLIGSVAPASGAALERSLAAGFPPDTAVGIDGLEQLFQAQLGGSPGGSLYAGRRLLATAAAQPGEDVRTSISPALQTLAVSELGTSVDGGIVVMDPRTGELLAAAGLPLTELQPPGSTFKIVTLTAALESHRARATTVFPYATQTVLDGFTLHNSNGEDCGGTLATAFAVSCNSVFAPLGVRVGAPRLLAAADAYGFNSPSPVAIAAESTIPPASLTDDLQVGESSIGQAQVLASPLQMLRAAATIALVGRRPLPTFSLVAPRRFPRVIPVTVARTVRSLMRDVVSYGTGTSAQIPGVVVAGKTGTAEVITPATCGATGPSGTTGTATAADVVATRTTAAPAREADVRAGGPRARAARVGSVRSARAPVPAVQAHASDTGGASAPSGGGASGAAGPTGGGASAPGGGSGSGGAGGGSGTAGSGAGTGSGSSAGSGSGAASAAGGSGASSSAPSAGATGASGCAGVDMNPYDTDAWFVGFAPEIRPRFVVAVLLPHEGAGGTTAAPLARVILEQALGIGG
jgi:hypothetical protein